MSWIKIGFILFLARSGLKFRVEDKPSLRKQSNRISKTDKFMSKVQICWGHGNLKMLSCQSDFFDKLSSKYFTQDEMCFDYFHSELVSSWHSFFCSFLCFERMRPCINPSMKFKIEAKRVVLNGASGRGIQRNYRASPRWCGFEFPEWPLLKETLQTTLNSDF